MNKVEKTINILNNFKTSGVLTELIDILNMKQIILDEENDFKGLSSTILENWDSDCTLFLQNNGYDGNILIGYACEVESRGWVYALYNPDYFESFEEVKNYIRRYTYN